MLKRMAIVGFLMITAVCLVIAAATRAKPAGDSFALSKTEAALAIKIFDWRQDVAHRMGMTQNKFQEDMDRLNEEARRIDSDSQQLVLTFKKAHKIDSTANYKLDEINGLLIKVK